MHQWEIAHLRAGVDALVIMGKRLAAIPLEGSELEARIAAAAWLYHCGLARVLVCLEGEVNRPYQPAGAQLAVRLLTACYRVPREAIIARSWSNCTRLEALGLRVLAARHGWQRLGAITAAYHAPRTRRIFRLAGLQVAVAEASERPLQALILPGHQRLFAEMALPALRAGRLPLRKRVEEGVKEAVLLLLSAVDPRGRIDLALAQAVRSGPSS